MKRKATDKVTPFKKKSIFTEEEHSPVTKRHHTETGSEPSMSEDDQASGVDEDVPVSDEENDDQDFYEDEESEAQDDEEDSAEEDYETEGEQASGTDEDDESNNHSSSKGQVQPKVHRVKPLAPKKKTKPGVIYINSIPKHMNVTILRSLLEPFGELGRVYLQPAEKDGKVRTKTASGKRALIRYTEGWVEFAHKRDAKALVPMLNMRPITNKKKSIFRDILWSMKYLPGFKWVHLNERLIYERSFAREKLRDQVQQIRKEASYYETKVHHKERALKNANMEKRAKKSKV